MGQRPGGPRPGNNPFASAQGMGQRPSPTPGNIPRPQAPRPGAPRPGAPAPVRAARSSRWCRSSRWRAVPAASRWPRSSRRCRWRRLPAPWWRSRRRARRRLRRSSRWRRRSWPWPRRWHRWCLRQGRRQVQAAQVASGEASRVRDAGCADRRWRQRHARQRRDHPHAPRRVHLGLRRQDRDDHRLHGAARHARDHPVQPGRDGHRDRVARRGDLRGARCRARLQDPDGLARGRGQGAPRGLRSRPRCASSRTRTRKTSRSVRRS